MKKICLFVMVFVFVISIIVPISVSAFKYEENDYIIDFIPGDINNDGRVNAEDARICLRAAASLETLTPEQIKAVDFDGSGKVSGSTARSILRASAKLETLTYTTEIESGQRIVFTELERVGAYEWVYNTDSTATEIIRTSEVEFRGDSGYYMTYHTLTTTEKDMFTVMFEHSCPWNGEINNSFDLNVVVSN